MEKDKKKKIKRYRILVNPDNLEDGFMDRISIVDNPAIERKGLYFHKEYKFKENKEKMEIIAPFLVPDLPILRRDENGEYFEVVFEKETIELLVEKFQKTGDNKRINYNHEDVMVDGYIKEIWIKESNNDKSSDYGFEDVPVGSAFMIVKIEDKDFWENEVKKMGFYGYSIELLADLELMEFAIATGSVDSSNVNQYRYDTETEILFITFNDGSTYKYYNVSFGEFMDIRDGNAQCITEGSNNYGRWWVGKTPSVGAAVYVYLVAAQKRFERSAFSSLDDILEFLTDDEVKEVIEDFVETYDDYPEAAKENAKTALRWAEENGWGDCGTPVGKARANQLAKGESISRETIARMAAFERHRQNSQKDLGDGCGRLMWLAWGGDEGIAWAQRKLEQIDREDFVIEPNPGESKDEFIGRCIAIEIDNGYDQSQAAAICYSKWENK